MAPKSVRGERREIATALRETGRSWVEIAVALQQRWPELSMVAAMRAARGWTQQEAADEWTKLWPDQPKSAKDIGLWENWPTGGRRPSLPALDRLARLYHCSASDLLTGIYDHRFRDVAAARNDADASESGGNESSSPGGDSRQASRPLALDGGPLCNSLPPSMLGPLGHEPDGVLGLLVATAGDRFAARVGRGDVETVRALTSALAGADNALGGGAISESGVGQLKWAATLLQSAATDEVQGELLEAVGNLAEVVGITMLDIGDTYGAERCFRFGLWCAEQSNSWSLRACALADLGRVFLDHGQVEHALSAIEFGLVRRDLLPSTAQAMIQVMHARYLALLGRGDEARRAIDNADQAMTDRDIEGDPVWLCYYDQAEHDGSAGRAMSPLAVATGRAELAAPRLAAAVEGQTAAYPRSKAFSTLRLATLHFRLGEPEEGASIAMSCLRQAGRLQSRRIAAELEQVRQAAHPHRSQPLIADLCDQISTTIKARPTAPIHR